jgi:hypothetical protein
MEGIGRTRHILIRAEWENERHLKYGRLVYVLPQFHTPDADIHMVYPQRHNVAAGVRAFVDIGPISTRLRASHSLVDIRSPLSGRGGVGLLVAERVPSPHR